MLLQLIHFFPLLICRYYPLILSAGYQVDSAHIPKNLSYSSHPTFIFKNCRYSLTKTRSHRKPKYLSESNLNLREILPHLDWTAFHFKELDILRFSLMNNLPGKQENSKLSPLIHLTATI